MGLLQLRRRHGRLLLLALACMALASQASAQTILIASNAVWKYLDDGSDQGSAWRESDFNDSAWAAGPAELGYGDASELRPETTVLSYGDDPNNKHVTYYFRHVFFVEDVSAISNLVARLLRDDGAVVYLNGVEVIRSNMPAGPVTFETFASPPGVGGAEEYTPYPSEIDPDFLVHGWNIMAVEIHQHSPLSADISFALELLTAEGEEPPPPAVVTMLRGPYLQIGTPTNITVRWRTSGPTDSRVRFGTALGNLALSVSDATLTSNHIIRLPNLQPNTKYFYSVGSSATNFPAGPDHYFVTSPAGAKTVRIWAIGDSGSAFDPNVPYYRTLGVIEDQRGVRDAYYNYAGSRDTDVWLLLGDNAYNNGQDWEYQTNFFQIYPDLIRHTVIWPTLGNHEVQGFTGEVEPYLDMFSMPINGEAGGVPSGNEHYYSFNYANVHFISLDSEVSSRLPGGPMLTWLEADLAANVQDWIIAYWHSPPYTKGSHNSDTEFHLIDMRQYVVPILESYGVDLVLCGHSHSYERSYLLNGHYGDSRTTWSAAMARDSGSGRPGETGPYIKSSGDPSAQGTVYVVAGSSGWAWPGVGLNHRAMFVGLQRLGSLIIDVSGNRLDAKFLRETGEIDDHFSMIKGVSPEPFRVASFNKNGNGVIVRWKSSAGHAYQVQGATELSESSWQDLSPVITATGATTAWTNAAGATAPTSFYRVSQAD